jgi:hypothetical protein
MKRCLALLVFVVGCQAPTARPQPTAHAGARRLAPGERCVITGWDAMAGRLVDVRDDDIPWKDEHYETALTIWRPRCPQGIPDWVAEHHDALRPVAITWRSGDFTDQNSDLPRFMLRPVD